MRYIWEEMRNYNEYPEFMVQQPNLFIVYVVETLKWLQFFFFIIAFIKSVTNHVLIT